MSEFEFGFYIGALVAFCLVGAGSGFYLWASERRTVEWDTTPKSGSSWRNLGTRQGTTNTGGHLHFFPWSEVKASKQGGPAPRCRSCGEAAR